MKRTFVALSLFFGLYASFAVGEPKKTDDTLFLCNFESLTRADFAAGSAALEAHGTSLVGGKWGKGLEVKPGQYLTVSAEGNLLPKRGTLMFWFKPNWSSPPGASHALISWGWDDGRGGYCVLSDSWWEPDGAGKTYLVFENWLYAHCSIPITYAKGEWMHFAFTWEFGPSLMVHLYLNGHRVCSTKGKPYKSVPVLRTPIFIGTDKGTPLAKNRWADGVVDGLRILNRPLSGVEIRDVFRAEEPNWKQVEARRNAWLHDVLKLPYTPKRDKEGRILESRALLDEGTGWVTREGAAASIDKLVRAGFDVYIPCVWHGRGARWPSKLVPMEKGVESVVKEEAGFDPLENLIHLAHSKGIEVHPWFCVCYRDPNWRHLLEFVEEGTPPRAFEAHNPEFRKFIVKLMMEVVEKYDVDGINLDYIRTRGLSASATARRAYRERFGTELLDDAKKTMPNGWPNPNIVKFQNEAIADIVRSVSRQARAARPGIVISIDGHPYLPTDRPGTQGRDGFRWAQEGWIDVIYCMDYAKRLSWQKMDAVRRALKCPSALVIIAGNYDRDEKGKVVPRDAQLVADLIAFCQRKYPGNGVALYYMGCLNDEQINALRSGPFKETAVPHWVRAQVFQPEK